MHHIYITRPKARWVKTYITYDFDYKFQKSKNYFDCIFSVVGVYALFINNLNLTLFLLQSLLVY